MTSELLSTVIRTLFEMGWTFERIVAEYPNVMALAYMETHYGDASFSIQSMAESFELSASYVSRFLKDQLGESARDYVQRLRIGRAKELLRTTKLTVNEIVSLVGYWDTTSFIKRFKASEGMTPGAYRARFAAPPA